MGAEVGADAAVPPEGAELSFDVPRIFSTGVSLEDETKVAGVSVRAAHPEEGRAIATLWRELWDAHEVWGGYLGTRDPRVYEKLGQRLSEDARLRGGHPVLGRHIHLVAEWNGQRFAFEGYLPQQPADRQQRVRELEQRSRREGQTQLVIETPYRNEALLQALAQHLQPETRLSVACGLTSVGGWCRTQAVSVWRSELRAPGRKPMADTLPAVFMWLAG